MIGDWDGRADLIFASERLAVANEEIERLTKEIERLTKIEQMAKELECATSVAVTKHDFDLLDHKRRKLREALDE